MAKPRARSLIKAAGVTLAIVVVVGAIAAAIAPRVVTGPRLGRLIQGALPAMRGRIQIGGGTWSWGEVIALWRGRATEVHLEDVRVLDPEGTLVLRAARVSARVEVRRTPLLVSIRELRVEDGEWRFASMAHENKVGFLAAMEPIARPGRARARPSARAEIAIERARLEHVSATFALSTWGLVLRDVTGTAGLAAGGGGGKPSGFSFEVRDADIGGGGQLRILRGAQAFELPFSRARLERVATTADAPDDIQLAASGVRTGGSTMRLAGTFFGIYGKSPASRDPGLKGEVHFMEAADAFAALARSRGLYWVPALGPGAELRVHFDGPYTRLRIDETVASKQVGKLEVTVSLAGSRVEAAIGFERFALAPLLPLPLVPFAAGTLDGKLRGKLDASAGAVSLDDVDLVLTRPANLGEPRQVQLRIGDASRRRARAAGFGVELLGAGYRDGVVDLPRVAFSLYGGRISASGTVALRDGREHRFMPPVLDLALRADRISIEKLVGVHFVTGSVSLRARVAGPIHDLGVALGLPGRQAVIVLGERYGLPARARLRIADNGGRLQLDHVRLEGPKASVLEAGGSLTMGGELSLSVGVRDFPVERLPGLMQTGLPIAGRISGDIELAGDVAAPAISGKLALDPVTFQGRSVGGGALVVTPGPRGAIHVRGRIIDGIEGEGTLAPGRAGLEGEATITLGKLKLDPFLSTLPTLPGGVSIAGIVSGRIGARVAPGKPASVEGRLTELVLVARARDQARRRAPLEIAAESGIDFSGRSGEGPIRIGPARFRGNIGTFELSGESRGGDARGTLRGRIELAALAPLLPIWIDRVTGALAVDLAARNDSAGRTSLDGEVAVAAPVTLRVLAIPADAAIPAGRVRFRDGTAETSGLPIRLRADHLADGAVRRLEADVRVDARVAALGGTPLGSARVTVDRATVDVPALGPVPIRSERGELAAELRGDTARVTRVELPLFGEVKGVAARGATVDRARFAVRLRGDPRKQLALSGDIQLDSVHASASALKAAQSPPAAKPGAGPSSPLQGNPLIENMTLDLRVRSASGAVAVDVPRLPDLRVDVDMHVGGTVKKPAVTGDARGANAWSSMALWLRRLFH